MSGLRWLFPYCCGWKFVEESICHGWSLEHVGRCIFRSCCGAWHSHLFLAAFLGLSHYWFTQQAKRLRMHFGCSRIWFAQWHRSLSWLPILRCPAWICTPPRWVLYFGYFAFGCTRGVALWCLWLARFLAIFLHPDLRGLLKEFPGDRASLRFCKCLVFYLHIPADCEVVGLALWLFWALSAFVQLVHSFLCVSKTGTDFLPAEPYG